MDSSIVEKIVKEIEHYAPTAFAENAGRVMSVGDGVVAIEGLTSAVMSEIVEFEETKGKSLEQSLEHHGKLYGLILNLEEDGVRATILGDTARVAEGMTVKSTGKI